MSRISKKRIEQGISRFMDGYQRHWFLENPNQSLSRGDAMMAMTYVAAHVRVLIEMLGRQVEMPQEEIDEMLAKCPSVGEHLLNLQKILDIPKPPRPGISTDGADVELDPDDIDLDEVENDLNVEIPQKKKKDKKKGKK